MSVFKSDNKETKRWRIQMRTAINRYYINAHSTRNHTYMRAQTLRQIRLLTQNENILLVGKTWKRKT